MIKLKTKKSIIFFTKISLLNLKCQFVKKTKKQRKRQNERDMLTYPSFIQDPSTGSLTPDRVRCKKCIKFGCLRRSDHDRDFNQVRDEDIIIQPCTICLLANDGYWGWDESGVKLKKCCGAFPGRDGISDVLSEHSTYELDETDDDSGIEGLAPDYQVILGFVQYAHYNHLKWNDIIDPEESPNMEDYRGGVLEGRRGDNWYWWKLIPRNLALTKKHIHILIQMIIDYKVVTPYGCVPKTHQNVSGTLSDDVWPDFWNTFVEPSHVAWIYRETMNKVLSEHCDKVGLGERLPTEGVLKTSISSFEIRDIRTSDVILRDSFLNPDTIQSILDDFLGSPHEESRSFFLIGHQYEAHEPDALRNIEYKHLKIRDRDIFGGYLDALVDPSHGWHGNCWLQNIPERYFTRTPVEFWNTPVQEDFQKLFDNAYKIIGFEDTSYWEDVQRVMDEIVVSDYTNELYYRNYLEHSEATAEAWSVGPSDRFLGGLAWPEDPLTENSGREEEMVGKLKEIQTIVDENVKDSVSEGVYLDIMNKMCDMYKLLKDSQ